MSELQKCDYCGKEYQKTKGVTLGIAGRQFNYCNSDCFSKASKSKKHVKPIAEHIDKVIDGKE